MNTKQAWDRYRKLTGECQNMLFRSEVLIGQTESCLRRSRLVLDAQFSAPDRKGSTYEFASPLQDLARCYERLINDEFKVESLTLEDHIILAAYIYRLKEKFEFKQLP